MTAVAKRKGCPLSMRLPGAGRVVGYYGPAPAAILPAMMPRSFRTGQPPSPVPACCSASSLRMSAEPDAG